MKRAELSMALSERGYFIGQVGTEISAVLGYNIDSQVARIDEIYIYPLKMASQTGKAVLEDIEIFRPPPTWGKYPRRLLAGGHSRAHPRAV